MNNATVIYGILSFVFIVGSAILGVVLMQNNKLANISDKKRNLYIGIAFGIVAIIQSMLFDNTIGTWIGRNGYKNCGIVPLNAGLCFGGIVGIISSSIGALYELCNYFFRGREYIELSDALCTLIAGINIWVVSKYVLRDRKPTYSFSALIALAYTAFNAVIYMGTRLIVYNSLINATVLQVVLAFLFNLILVELTQLLRRKIETGYFFDGIDFKGKDTKIKGLIIIPMIVSMCLITGFMYQYLNIVLWEPISSWVKDDLQHTAILIEKDVDSDNWDTSDMPTPYEGGGIIIFDKDRYAIYYDLSVADIDVLTIDYDDAEEYSKNTDTINGKNYVWVFQRVGEYTVMEIIPEDAIYLSRAPLMMLAVCMEVLILYLMICGVLYVVNRNYFSEINKSIRVLETVIGKNYNESSSNVGDLFDSSLTRGLNEITKRINDEVKLVANLQLQSLPMKEAMSNGIVIHPFIKPARQVGGDFYDYFKLDQTKGLFLIADVSGKGMSAAMFMMKAKATVRSLAFDESDMEKLLIKINKTLCEGNPEGMFVAMWIGIIDTLNETIEYVNAALGDQVMRCPHGDYGFIDDIPQAPMGIKADKVYEIKTLSFAPGSRLVLCTDGVTEANDAAEEMYSEERLLTFLNDNCKLSNSKETLTLLTDDIHSFTGDAEQFDDITALVVDYYGDATDCKVVSKTFVAQDENLDAATDFINESLSALKCDDAQLMEIEVAFEELFVNISHYAYPQSIGNVTIEVSTDHGQAMIRLIDSGMQFNPLRQSKQDENTPLKDRKEGGLGITMVKTCMNYLDYRYEDGKNILTMIKTVK